MKKLPLLYLMFFAGYFTTIHAQGTWQQKADFGESGRSGAVGLSIGSKGYIGTGSTVSGLKKDFWEYNPTLDVWSQKADFEGSARNHAVAFAIGDKGYVGTGSGSTGNLKDFWEYDPALNTWTQKADFAEIRDDAFGFSIGNKGYLGTGSGTAGVMKDFWEYDPAVNVWVQKADYGGGKRLNATSFSIENRGYVGTGYSSGDYYNDFWEYNPDNDMWTEKATFGGYIRRYASGFSIGGKGYIGTGYYFLDYYDYAYYDDFWEYDPATNTWVKQTDFNESRYDAVGLSIGNYGYIGSGKNETAEMGNDIWEYIPDEISPTCNPSTNLTTHNINQSTTTLKWNAISETIFYKVSYKIEGSSAWNTIKSLDNIKTLHQLAPGTEYVWKVKSICGIKPTIASDWSEKVFFTTAPFKLSSDSETPSLEVFPNPLSNTSTISFSLPEATHATIELYDVAGRKLQTILDQNIAAGNQQVIFQRRELSSGLYLLQVKMGAQVEMKKLVVE